MDVECLDVVAADLALPTPKCAVKCAEDALKTVPGPAAPATGFERSKKLMKKPFAWVSKGALWTKLPNLRVLVLKISYLEVKLPEVGLGSCRAALS